MSVTADAAALFVARQIVAIDRRLHGRHGRCEPRRGFGRQELRQEEERALLHECAAQRLERDAGREPGQISPAPEVGLAAIGFSRRTTRR